MKINRYLGLLICCTLFSNCVISQQITTASPDSSLYLFPQFTDGTLQFRNGEVMTGKLNYNTYLDHIQFLGTKKEILSLAEPEKVIKVVIANRNFINTNKYFVELISDGPVFLCVRVHTKRVAEKIGAYGTTGSGSNISTVASYRINGRDSDNLTVNEKVNYKNDLIFYVLNNKTFREVATQKDLLKCFSVKKDLLKQELDKQHTKFNSIESMKKIFEWINANGIKN